MPRIVTLEEALSIVKRQELNIPSAMGPEGLVLESISAVWHVWVHSRLFVYEIHLQQPPGADKTGVLSLSLRRQL